MSSEDEKIRELFKEKHKEEWNPIIIELPYFGSKEDKIRKSAEGLSRIYAQCGYEVAFTLALGIDESLCEEAMELSQKIDLFRKRHRQVAVEKMGDPHGTLLNDIFGVDGEKPSS